MIYTDATPVEFYPYRQAFARDIFLEIRRNNNTIDTFEKRLARKLHKETDNHTTYALKTKSGVMIYITCSDSTYYIGTSIEVKNW